MVVMGRVAAPHGVLGWIRVHPFTQEADGLARYPEWWLGGAQGMAQWTVEASAVHGRGLIAKLQGCNDRNAAEKLVKLDISVPRDALPKSEDGAYYRTDLIGLPVENVRGEALGEIESIIETGANEVLVVQGERERLIPFIEQVIVEVDLERRQVVVDWGLDY